MANIKSSKKRAKTNEKRRILNVARRSDIKTATKVVLNALESNDIEKAKQLLKIAEVKISRGQGKGL